MKFRLKQVGYLFDKKMKEKNERLGFLFEKTDPDFLFSPKDEWTIDKDEVDIEIKSLEDLLEFIKEWGEIEFDGETITIDNDYLEYMNQKLKQLENGV